MLREAALNLSQSLKVRKTKPGFTLTENNIRKKIPMTGRAFAVETIHINNKITYLCDSRSKKKFVKRMPL
jgi:ribosomal protein S6E (S10)